MADRRPIDVSVAPLGRALLEGVDDAAGAGPRRVDLAILTFFEDERPLQGLGGLVDWRAGGSLSALLRSGFCTGAAGEAVLLPAGRTMPMERLVLVGLGPSRAFDRAAAEAAGERLVTVALGLRPRDVLVAMPGRAPERAVVEAVFDGLTRALGMRAPKDLDVQAQRAAKAVGDESSEGPLGRHVLPSPTPPSHDGPVGPRPVLVAAEEPSSEAASKPTGDSAVVSLDGSARDAAPEDRHEPDVCRWWVVADPRHEARLRRLLEGPPRAAEPGA